MSFTAQQNAIASNPPSTGEGGATGISIPPVFNPTPEQVALSIAENNAQPSIAALDNNNVPQMYADLSRLNPRSMAYASLQGKISQAMAAAVADGYSSGAISKANQIANMNVPDIFGNVTLALTLGDQEFDAVDIASMSDADFSALSANPATGVKGDPESPLGMAVMGLGTTGLGLLSPALALPTMAIDALSSLTPGRSTGLMSLLGIPGMMNVVGKELGLGETPVSDVKGYMGDVAGYIGEQTGLSDIDFGAASLGISGEPSPYGGRPSNLGPGISLPPPAGIPSVDIGLPVPPTTVTETLEDATSSFYDAQQLADATGATLAQAEEYLASRYA
jgi:hypothetical protein